MGHGKPHLVQAQAVPVRAGLPPEPPLSAGLGTGRVLEPTGNRRPREMVATDRRTPDGTELGLSMRADLGGSSERVSRPPFCTLKRRIGLSKSGPCAPRRWISDDPAAEIGRSSRSMRFFTCLWPRTRKDTALPEHWPSLASALRQACVARTQLRSRKVAVAAAAVHRRCCSQQAGGGPDGFRWVS